MTEQSKVEKRKRWIRSIKNLIVKIVLLIAPVLFYSGLFSVSIYYRTFDYLTILATMFEIYGVFIVFLSELFASSFVNRWHNPDFKNGIPAPFKQTKDFLLKDGKKYFYLNKQGRFFKAFLTQIEDYVGLYDGIKSSWYYLWHDPVKEGCNFEVDFVVYKNDSIKEVQEKIIKLNTYSSTKVVGYFLIFTGFVIQFIYNLLIQPMWN